MDKQRKCNPIRLRIQWTFLCLIVSGLPGIFQAVSASFEAGDCYAIPGGEHRLLRLPGVLAIRFKAQVQRLQGVKELTALGGPLEGYRFDSALSNGLCLFRTSFGPRPPEAFLACSEAIARARCHPAIQAANPVFVDPGTSLARLLTEEILIRLKPQVDSRAYFGQEWAKVKPLKGTPDQFILTLPLVASEELLAEVGQRASDPRVAWAEPNFLSQVLKQTSDPLFANQWPLKNLGRNGALTNSDVRALGAWTNSVGSPGIVIAMVDDGTQLDHPDLRANVFSNAGESLNGLDDDGNGYVDDLHGWNFYRDDNDPTPEFEEDNHGTASAGIAAAAGNNGIGIAGIAYRCQIMPLKVMAGGNWAADSSIAEALYYAAGRTRDGLGTWRGADVISISLSFPQSSVVDGALAWASTNGRGGQGCPIFAAAGDAASRWNPTRIRIPIGEREGPGVFKFGFEYSKDVSISEGEDLVKIDNVSLLAADGVTHLVSPLGSNGRQDFEEVFPPAGWQLSASLGAAYWRATTNGALTGTRGSISAQSGRIFDDQWTELQSPLVTLTGGEILSFSCYISSEADWDGLKIWVYDENNDYVDVFESPLGAPLISGNSLLSPSIPYPANHPDVMAVGASTDADVRSDYSQSGAELDFLAPSSGGWNDILTTDRTGTNGYAKGDYAYDFGGTSAACPLAAGIGALVVSVDPWLTAAGIRAVLRSSCDKIGSVTYVGAGWNTFYGYGRLNAQQAVASAKTAAAQFEVICASSKIVEAGIPWNFDAPTGVSSCNDTQVLIKVLNTVTNSRLCGNTFTAVRIWQVTDNCNHRGACTQMVNVVDTTPPSISCGSNKGIVCATAWSFDIPTAFDLASVTHVTITIVNTVTNGNCSPTFTATRTWRATDPCGNTSTCSQTVTNLQVVLGGTVYYPSLYPSLNPSDKPVPGVTLKLSGDEDQTTQTAADGTYSFTVDAGRNFTITPNWTNNNSSISGITTLDILSIRKHILGLLSLDSPYKLLAADVNGSRSITSLDVSRIRKVILGLTNAFPAGLWRWVPSDYVFPDPSNPWDAPASRSYANLVTNIAGQDFLAIDLGDVNNSWTPPHGPSGESRFGPAVLKEGASNILISPVPAPQQRIQLTNP